MAIEITIPRLGWSMDEGTFGEWLKADGEFVRTDEPVFTLESEKALQEVEAVDEGYLKIIPDGPREGDTVTVGTVVAWLLAEGEPMPTLPTQKSASVRKELLSNADSTLTEGTAITNAPMRRSAGSPAVSPRAARLAAQLGIDCSTLKGGGSSGRIREADVRAAASANVRDDPADSGTRSIRRQIAERMLASVQTTAPVTLTTRVDATNLVALREQFRSEAAGFQPGYLAIVTKLAAIALKEHPVMNLLWTGSEFRDPGGIHIGVAVDTEAGLLVPVVRNVDQLTLQGVTEQSRLLIEKARRRECTPSELSGGTFSMTNLGAFGVEFFTPILNPGQTAILGLGAIRAETSLAGERPFSRNLLPLSLTFDHRAVDGAPAARFLKRLSTLVENPGPALIT